MFSKKHSKKAFGLYITTKFSMEPLRCFFFPIHMNTLLENQESEELLLVYRSALCLNLSLKELSTIQLFDINSFPYFINFVGSTKERG